MTNSPDGFELEKTRRDLIAMRVKHGAKTPVGQRCSNLIEQLQNYETATGAQRTTLHALINMSMTELARMTRQRE